MEELIAIIEGLKTKEISFGKHKGRTLEWVYNEDKKYLEWFSKQNMFNEAIVKIFFAHMESEA